MKNKTTVAEPAAVNENNLTGENGTALTDEQAAEVVKKRRRGFDVLKDFGAEPGDNTRFLRFALASWDLPPIDISDPVQVKNRIGEYFQHCADNDRKPQIVGMCNWLGINRNTLNEWLNGVTRSATHGDMIKKAVSIIEEQWADYMLNGKVNPGSGIFIAKNWFGYRDQTDVVVTPQNPLDNLNADEARKKLTESIPDDDE